MPRSLSFSATVLLPPRVRGLTRGKSLQCARNKLRKGSSFLTSSTNDSHRRVPTEVLERIIQVFVESCYLGRVWQRSLLLVVNLTLVSKTVRQMVLRHFFGTLGIENVADQKLFKFLAREDLANRERGWFGGFSWVRALYVSSQICCQESDMLRSFSLLNNLWITCARDGPMTQRPRLTAIFDNLRTDCTCARNLTTLTITCMPRIDDALLRRIAEILPNLTDLYLSSIDALSLDCCACCFGDSMSLIQHSPIPDVYSDIAHLTTSIGTTLAPLQKLKRLFLGVFLSPTFLLDLHFDHVPEWMPVSTLLSAVDCPRCLKFLGMTRDREVRGSLLLAQHLPSVEIIGWSTCYEWSEEELEAEEGKFFVLDETQSLNPVHLESTGTEASIAAIGDASMDFNGDPRFKAKFKVLRRYGMADAVSRVL